MVRIYRPPTALGRIEKQPAVQDRYVRVTLQDPGDGLVGFYYVVLLGKEDGDSYRGARLGWRADIVLRQPHGRFERIPGQLNVVSARTSRVYRGWQTRHSPSQP